MHDTNTHTPEGGASVLTSLRKLIPNRPLLLSEALWIAELQAARLLQLRGASDVPVLTTIVTELPRITIEHDPDLPADAASGCSDWDWRRRSWIISINPAEPRTRQRFTVLHEYKHILDHGSHGITPSRTTQTRRPPEEVIADYFAGCVLMPKRLLTAAYYDGIQQPADLAELFDVSEAAIQVRLNQIGLGDPGLSDKASRLVYRQQPRSSRRPASYYRSSTETTRSDLEVAR